MACSGFSKEESNSTKQVKSNQNKTKTNKFLNIFCRTDTMEKDERCHVTVMAKMTQFIDKNSQSHLGHKKYCSK